MTHQKDASQDKKGEKKAQRPDHSAKDDVAPDAPETSQALKRAESQSARRGEADQVDQVSRAESTAAKPGQFSGKHPSGAR